MRKLMLVRRTNLPFHLAVICLCAKFLKQPKSKAMMLKNLYENPF